MLRLPFWAVALILAGLLFLATPVRVSGESMRPTLGGGDVVLLWRPPVLAWRAGVAPPPGAVLVYRVPSWAGGGGGLAVKRLIAGPGQTVEIRGGALWVDGARVAEPQPTQGEFNLDLPPRRLGEGEFFFLGDNRFVGESTDSREYGPVPRSGLRGAVPLRLWPRPGLVR